jgi:hypothetical protein
VTRSPSPTYQEPDRPADDRRPATRRSAVRTIEHESGVHPPGHGLYVRDVSDPCPVRRRRIEATFQQVLRPLTRPARQRRARPLALGAHFSNTQLASTARPCTAPPRLPHDSTAARPLASPVHPTAGIPPHPFDLRLHIAVPNRTARRDPLSFLRRIVGRRRKLQGRADRLDAEPVPVRFNELD